MRSTSTALTTARLKKDATDEQKSSHEKKSSTNLAKLSSDLQGLMLTFADRQSIGRFLSVSKQSGTINNNPHFWRKICELRNYYVDDIARTKQIFIYESRPLSKAIQMQRAAHQAIDKIVIGLMTSGIDNEEEQHNIRQRYYNDVLDLNAENFTAFIMALLPTAPTLRGNELRPALPLLRRLIGAVAYVGTHIVDIGKETVEIVASTSATVQTLRRALR